MMKTKIIYNCIVFAILGLLFALPLIKVPVSVSAAGAIRPSNENVKIVSLVSGRIVQSNLFTTNQFVNKGDTLLVITSAPLRSKKSFQDNMQIDYQAQLHDLKILTSAQPNGILQTGLYQTERASLKIKLSEVQTQVDLAERELKRNSILYDDGVIPESEYEKSLHNYEQLKKQKGSIREQQIVLWQTKKREIEQQLRSSMADVEAIGIEEENYIIKASSNGTITNLQGFDTGNYLVQGQHLADISQEEILTAECYVPASSIGFVRIGQPVKFQIDTYNYNQWGMLDGIVTDINNNVIVNEKTGASYFLVRCDLSHKFLSLKNGYQAKVGKGNTFTARFYLTDRTLWQLLFDRVDDWFNPHLVKNHQ